MKKKMALLITGGIIVIAFLIIGYLSYQNRTTKVPTVGQSNSHQLPTGTSKPAKRVENVILPYDNTNPFNPYLNSNLCNQQLIPLIFDSLFELDEFYNAKMVLATSIKLQENLVIVTILDDVFFSDGSRLVADDVITSFNLAKSTLSPYKEQLYNISNATKIDDQTIQFSLKNQDRYIANILTFPIVKMQYDLEQTAIGTGVYHLLQDELIVNNYHKMKSVNLKTIQLLAMDTQPDFLREQLRKNKISLYYDDLRENTYVWDSVSSKSINTNNLVFIGINPNRGLFSSSARQAIHFSVDRSTIVDNVYLGKAISTYTPFHPIAKEFSELEYKSTFNLIQAQELLKTSGFYIDKNEEKTVEPIRILVANTSTSKYNVAKIIQKNLDIIGIPTVIDVVNSKNFHQNVSSGNYDLYIGEIKLLANMDILPLLSNDFFYGIGTKASPELLSSYYAFRAGKIQPQEFLDLFEQELPIIPIVFRNSVVYYKDEAFTDMVAINQNIFYNIEDW